MLHLMDPDGIADCHGRLSRDFCFDQVFQDRSSNIEVYSQTIRPMLDNLLQGFNATCFAYGMTGAGKTHTMFGDYATNN